MFYSKFDNRKHESLYEYHVNYKPTKKEIITHNISMFRHNVVNEFINLVDNFVYDAFLFFNEEIGFEHIITKEDFDDSLNHLYDSIAESYYFDGWKYDDDVPTYRQGILEEMEFADFKEKREITKKYLKTRKFDTLRMDGVLDNIFHAYFDFKHLLPTTKEFYYSFKDFNELNNQKGFLTMDIIFDRLKEVRK